MLWRSLRLAKRLNTPRRALAGLITVVAFIGCQNEESAARARIAGDYAVQPRDSKGVYARQLLTLRTDGTWLRRRLDVKVPEPQHMGPDSGTYRIVGVMLNLRSLGQGGPPVHYTMAGDTLFEANAAEMQKFTGDDIGQERLIRVR
ncbi:MAG: hypothetical protein ACT4P6_00520 [Gemmatimonadaceae bacterium]